MIKVHPTWSCNNITYSVYAHVIKHLFVSWSSLASLNSQCINKISGDFTSPPLPSTLPVDLEVSDPYTCVLVMCHASGASVVFPLVRLSVVHCSVFMLSKEYSWSNGCDYYDIVLILQLRLWQALYIQTWSMIYWFICALHVWLKCHFIMGTADVHMCFP